MESPLGFATAHWDHEPCQRVGRGVFTAPRPGGPGTARPTLRFMESEHLPKQDVSWCHEPNPSRPRPRPRPRFVLLVSRTRTRTRTKRRFMESLRSFFRMHWDHEPRRSGVSAERRNSWEQPASGALPRRRYGAYGPWRTSLFHRYNFHPLRYSRRTYWAASGAF